MSSDQLFMDVVKSLFSNNGEKFLNPDNEFECLEGYYQNPYDFQTWDVGAPPNKPTGADIGLPMPKTASNWKKVTTKNRFIEEVKYLVSQVLDEEFPVHDNPPIMKNELHGVAGHANDINLDNYSYTIRDNSGWFTSRDNTKRFLKFYNSTTDTSPGAGMDTLYLLHNLSREVPIVEDRLKKWIGDGLADKGWLNDATKMYSSFIVKYDSFNKKAEDFLKVAMYNSQEVKFIPDIKAFFTSYVPEDIGYQLQEIRTTDGRLFTRTFSNDEWSNWDLGSPDKTKTSSIELTSGDVGSVPLGNQGGVYKFNVLLEAMQPGEVLYCLTRDITLSGLPESLRYGSIGYRNTPDEILSNPARGIFPNSLGAYGLFDPQNDINEPDSNGLMEIMPSTELFSDEIPRPISEQQRGWLETKYDGLYYFQNWTPLSPSNINWCEEQDQPRYLYHRKGTLQIADQISGAKPFILWTEWHRENNVETVVDWGEITPEILSKKLKLNSTETVFSILGLSDLYKQPVDTTYMWTIVDEGNDKFSASVERPLGFKEESLFNSIQNDHSSSSSPSITPVTEFEKVTDTKERFLDSSTKKTMSDTRPEAAGAFYKDQLSTKIAGIPSIRNEGGPPLRLISDPFEGIFKSGNVASAKRKSIFSRLTSVKTKDILYYEWRDLGQVYRKKFYDGVLSSDKENLDTEYANKKHFLDRKGYLPLPDQLFTLKEKSSDFCYYREGRIISKQVLESLPEKVIETYAIWTAWHSIDERLKSIESRVNFIEMLQGLAPASNYMYIPSLSYNLHADMGIKDTDEKKRSSIKKELFMLNHGRNTRIGKSLIGEYSPLYYLRFGYNHQQNLYDTSRSFWGNWINYAHIGTSSASEKIDYIFPQINGGFTDIIPTRRGKETTVQKDSVHGGVFDGSLQGLQPIPSSNINMSAGQSQIVTVLTVNELGKKAYEGARIISPVSMGIMIAEMVVGIIGAFAGPAVVANAAITVVAVTTSLILMYNCLSPQLGPKVADIYNQLYGMWSPEHTPMYDGSYSLKYGARRNRQAKGYVNTFALDPNDETTIQSSMIDTSLWGWLSEVKRRTDVIKFIEATLNYAINLISQTIAVFNADMLIVIGAQLPIPPSTGVTPIPFIAIGVPGASLTSFSFYTNAFSFVPYCPGKYGFNNVFDSAFFHFNPPSGDMGLLYSNVFLESMFLERTYEDDYGLLKYNSNKDAVVTIDMTMPDPDHWISPTEEEVRESMGNMGWPVS
jgi:hypothetical protein